MSETNTQSAGDRAAAARDTALTDLDGAADVDDPVDQAQAEQSAVESFIDELAAAVVDGYSTASAKQMCGVVSDVSQHYTKTALKDRLLEAISEKKVADSDRRRFSDILREDLREVVIIRTTDAKQDTKYRWEFVDGSVETEADSDGRAHFHWSTFRDEYFDAIGKDAAKPEEDLLDGEDWREFVVDIIEAQGREQTTRGPRTAAVEQLKDFISRSRAFNDLEAVVERDAVFIDADPRDENPTELWVLNHDIKRICEDNELSSVRELQIELDARGHTVDRIRGVSETTTVNGKTITYWALSARFAEPDEFVPDPVDPAESVREEERDEDDEDDDYEPGVIGSTGGDGDE